MAFNDVIIRKGQGGLGRSLPGTDYISGLLFYSDQTAPTGFTSANQRIITVYSVEDAEDNGIVNTHAGATASTATYQFTTKFTVGDTFKITCATIDSVNPIASIASAGTVTLASFTAVTADAVDTTTSATRLAAEINLGTVTHGFSATSNTATVTITAPKSQGIFLNSGTPYAVTIVGVAAGTLTQNVVSGVASHVDILHYHVTEFFRLQPKGKLWVSFQATADVGTFAKATTLQEYSGGEIKQLGVWYASTAFTSAHCTTLQSINTALETLHMPYWSILLAGEISGTANVTGLTTNLRTLNAPTVSVVIGQDGAAQGFTLFKATGKSITNMGEQLGAVAISNVNESIAWLSKFQVSATELDYPAYANGQLFRDVSNGTSVNLDSYGYNFVRKVTGLGGTYHNRPYTCVSATSDYTYIYNNRTIYKAIANVRTVLLPETGRPVLVNADGTLTEDVIGYFQGLCKQALDVMVRDAEISNFAAIIDPAQNILSTGILYVTIQIQPVGVADFITVNIGFTDIITA